MPNYIINNYTNLKKKSFLIELLPWVGGGTSTTIYPNVYLSRKVYKSIYSSNPDPYKISTVIHEEEHVKRIKQLGPKMWYRQYVLDRKFRFEEELAATIPQLAYLKARGLQGNLEHRAKVLSGHLYLWPVKKEEALKRLILEWDRIRS